MVVIPMWVLGNGTWSSARVTSVLITDSNLQPQFLYVLSEDNGTHHFMNFLEEEDWIQMTYKCQCKYEVSCTKWTLDFFAVLYLTEHFILVFLCCIQFELLNLTSNAQKLVQYFFQLTFCFCLSISVLHKREWFKRWSQRFAIFFQSGL